MTFLDTEMKELGRSIQINTRNTRTLMRTPQVCLRQLAEAFTVKEYKHAQIHTQKHTHTHTHTHNHTHRHTNTRVLINTKLQSNFLKYVI